MGTAVVKKDVELDELLDGYLTPVIPSKLDEQGLPFISLPPDVAILVPPVDLAARCPASRLRWMMERVQTSHFVKGSIIQSKTTKPIDPNDTCSPHGAEFSFPADAYAFRNVKEILTPLLLIEIEPLALSTAQGSPISCSIEQPAHDIDLGTLIFTMPVGKVKAAFIPWKMVNGVALAQMLEITETAPLSVKVLAPKGAQVTLSLVGPGHPNWSMIADLLEVRP
jgi:hypothetical protein